MNNINPSLQDAMRLMRSGDLQAATRAIQHGLAGGQFSTSQNDETFRAPATHAPASIIDGEFSVVDRVDAKKKPENTAPVSSPETSGFKSRRYSGDAGEIDYKLFIPAGLDTTNAPLLLMLHGCTQSPEDFATGTRMNALAQQQGYVVAYPEQSAARNANRCWNWFRSSDQKRDGGEPALLAALTRQLIATHRLDQRRVFVAGLSAGGAMAAVLADTHPDLYAAIGVHSGLPTGLASDVASAFAAMRNGKSSFTAAPRSGTSPPLPTIVFHGANDATVHPSNGHGVIAQSLARHHANGASTIAPRVERGKVASGHRYSRTIHENPDGQVVAEHWAVEGAGHAWSGGDAGGSYTDPNGPDASAEMLRFFAQHAH